MMGTCALQQTLVMFRSCCAVRASSYFEDLAKTESDLKLKSVCNTVHAVLYTHYCSSICVNPLLQYFCQNAQPVMGH
jgi:hypothetical protein